MARWSEYAAAIARSGSEVRLAMYEDGTHALYGNIHPEGSAVYEALTRWNQSTPEAAEG